MMMKVEVKMDGIYITPESEQDKADIENMRDGDIIKIGRGCLGGLRIIKAKQ
jgi:hypothetical protein